MTTKPNYWKNKGYAKKNARNIVLSDNICDTRVIGVTRTFYCG